MITVADVFDAIEKNGLTKIKGSYLSEREDLLSNTALGNDLYQKSDLTGGCALGQASVNLGIAPIELVEMLNIIGNGRYIAMWIIEQNDHTEKTLQRIAQEGRMKFTDYLDLELL